MGFYRLIRRKLRSAGSLSGSDWWVFIQAWSLLLAIDVGLHLLPFRRIQRLLARVRKNDDYPCRDNISDIIHYYHWLVLMAARNHLYEMGCLRRTLALQWLLRRRGIQTDLRIGVKRDDGKFSAHAWLEYQGNPVGEAFDVETSFAQLRAIDTASSTTSQISL